MKMDISFYRLISVLSSSTFCPIYFLSDTHWDNFLFLLKLSEGWKPSTRITTSNRPMLKCGRYTTVPLIHLTSCRRRAQRPLLLLRTCIRQNIKMLGRDDLLLANLCILMSWYELDCTYIDFLCHLSSLCMHHHAPVHCRPLCQT